MMKSSVKFLIFNFKTSERGFSLVELLVAAAIFTFIVSSVSGLFIQALNIQRRATSMQKIQEHSQFILETISREIRVSTVTSGDSSCSPAPDPVATSRLDIQHPVNGPVSYRYDSSAKTLSRNGQMIVSSDLAVTKLAFCVSGSGGDGFSTRVTIPMTLESTAGPASQRVTASFQATMVSRDVIADLSY